MKFECIGPGPRNAEVMPSPGQLAKLHKPDVWNGSIGLTASGKCHSIFQDPTAGGAWWSGIFKFKLQPMSLFKSTSRLSGQPHPTSIRFSRNHSRCQG